MLKSCIGHLEDELHLAFAYSSSSEHLRRQSVEDEIDAYFDSPPDHGEPSHPLVIAGAPGSGKSSTLADWALRRRAAPVGGGSGRLRDREEFVFYHAVGCSRGSVSVGKTLRRLMDALRDHFGLTAAVDENDGRLPWTFPRFLELAAKKGSVLIVIDGIHHIRAERGDGANFSLKWLPQSFPSNVRMLLSMTTPPVVRREGEPGPPDRNEHLKLREGKIRHVMQEVKRRGWRVVPMGELGEGHVTGLMRRHERDVPSGGPDGGDGDRGFALRLPPEMADAISSHPESTNPRFLTALLRALTHAAGRGYDLWSCLEGWIRNSHSACGLVHQVLNTYETGHQVSQQKVASEAHEEEMKLTHQCGSAGDDRKQGGHSEERYSPEDVPVCFRGGQDVPGLGPMLGHALALLFVSRHGLHETELFPLLLRVEENEKWTKDGLIRPIETKLFRSLERNKKRLIDIFRSFDTDGNGTLSHKEFYRGMEQLGIGVTRHDVSELIKTIDSNGDGEIDYQEILDHFEHISRCYTHGKRRESLIEGDAKATKDPVERNKKISTYKETRRESLTDYAHNWEALLSSLLSLGVIRVQASGVLILPLESTTLRDAVWSRYIHGSKREEVRWHSTLIEFFTRQEPNLRRCEELPWHLKKVKKFGSLRQALVDLRTFDIMYNGDMSFRAELFDYLRLLTDGSTVSHLNAASAVKAAPFDIVNEYNRAVEVWYQGTRPSAVRLAAMASMIFSFMKWFDEKMSGSMPPPFMRTALDPEGLRSIGLDDELRTSSKHVVDPRPDGEHRQQLHVGVGESSEQEYDRPTTIGDVESTPAKQKKGENSSATPYYFSDRWVWIMFPWMALKNVPLYCEHAKDGEGMARTGPRDQGRTDRFARDGTQAIGADESSPPPMPPRSDRRFRDVEREGPREVKEAARCSDDAMARSESFKKSASVLKVEKMRTANVPAAKVGAAEANIPFAYDTVRTSSHGSRYPSAQMMHIDSVKSAEEGLDAIAWKATERFGGQSLPIDIEDVADIRRDEEAVASAAGGLYASHASARLALLCTQKELDLGKIYGEVSALRELFDRLRAESTTKEQRLADLQDAAAERDLGDRQVSETAVTGEEILSMMRERHSRLNGLVNDATSLGAFFHRITLSLASTNPEHHKKHLRSLEQQIALSRQQRTDLLKSRQGIFLEIKRINTNDKRKWADILRASERKRMKIKQRLRDMGKIYERRNSDVQVFRPKFSLLGKAAILAAKISYSAHQSKLITPETIPGRKSEQDGNNQILDGNKEGASEKSDLCRQIEALNRIAGSVDPQEIMEKIKQAESRERSLRNQQSAQEETIRELKEKLQQLKKRGLTEVGPENNKQHEGNEVRIVDEELRDTKIKAAHYIKQTNKLLALTNKVKSGISHLVDMARCLGLHPVSDPQSLSVSSDDAVLLKTVGDQLVRMVEMHCSSGDAEAGIYLGKECGPMQEKEHTQMRMGMCGSHNPNSNETSPAFERADLCTPQIRVLNLNQRDFVFEKTMRRMIAEEDKKMNLEEMSQAVVDLQNENEHISTFVVEALSSRETRNEQRRANILSSSKHGKYADRGVIIETVLKRASEELTEEPRDGQRKKNQDATSKGRVTIKQESSHIISSSERPAP